MNDMRINVAIVDVGCCNLGSFEQALNYIGVDTKTIARASELHSAVFNAVCVPGSGNSSMLASRLKDEGFSEKLYELSMDQFPVIGVCSGMHALFKDTHEPMKRDGVAFDKVPGVGIFEGSVTKIWQGQVGINLGWRNIFSDGWMRSLEQKTKSSSNLFYFMHGFGVLYNPTQHSNADTIMLNSDQEIIAMIRKRNTYGIQFHPERSGNQGLALLGKIMERFSYKH